MENNLDDYYKNKYHKIYKFLGQISINKKISTLTIIIKYLPLLLITHDWKISKKYGISYYIRKFTLSEIIFNLNNIVFFYIILYICFIIVLLNYFTLMRIMIYNKNINSISLLRKSNIFLYICNPYLYSIFTEIIFNEKLKNKISNPIYFLTIIIISISTIYLIFIDILLSSVLLEQLTFIGNNSIFTNEIGKLDLLTFIFSLLQIFIQIEFNIKEKYMICIKFIIRILLVIIFLFNFFDHSHYYYRINIEYIMKFFYYLCFSSIIIEFFALQKYYKNKYFILQEDTSILVIKILIEICLSIILTYIYFKIEFNIMKKDFSNFNFNAYGTYNNNIIKVFNLIYFMDKPDEIKIILNHLNKSFQTKIHIPKCKKEEKQCFFCHIYDFDKFEEEISLFITFMKKNEAPIKKNKYLKEECPILYQYFSYGFENISFININYSKKYYTIVLLIITFYYAFEHEYFKCLFLIETIKFNKTIKISFLKHFQLYILKSRILEFYSLKKKNTLENYVNIRKEKEDEIKNIIRFTNNFESINIILKIEKYIKTMLTNFQYIMKTFNEDNISFNEYSLLIKNYSNDYQFNLNKLKILFNKLKCTVIFPIKKITVPFDFLISEIPGEIMTSMKNFFSNQPSLLDDDKKRYLITIKLKHKNGKYKFLINYISDELLQKLNYKRNELNDFDFIDFFPKAFFKSYLFCFRNGLRNGTEYLQLKYLCLQDKFNYVSIFDFKGLALSTPKGIQFFFQLKDSKEEKILEKKKSLNFNKDLQNNLTGSCFLFTNKYGRINHISHGFEDFFFLNTIIFKQYKIYVQEIFHIRKLKKKGNFEIDLGKVLDNINALFNKEVGQISDDEFSKIIIKLRTFEETLLKIKFSFIVTGYFEKRNFQITNDKEKCLYIFYFFIKLKKSHLMTNETNILYLEDLINQDTKKLTSNTQLEKNENSFITNLEAIALNPPQTFDKESRFWFLLKKVKNINQMCIILLKKYFLISINKTNKNNKNNLNVIEDEKTIKDKEEKEILNYNEMSKKNLKASFMVKIYQYKFIQQYSPSFISFIFYIILIILFIIKINEILNLKEYVISFGAGNMYVQIVNQMLLKVLQIQFVSNNLHKEMRNDTFNNSHEFNIEELNERIKEYITYCNSYGKFMTNNYKGRKYLLNRTKVIGNYSLPLINGSKDFFDYQVFHNYVHVMLNEILENGKIYILYNNSNYYYNESMINNFTLSKIEYLDKASSYVEFLENFSLYFTFIASELQNVFFNQIIIGEIVLQKKVSVMVLITEIAFSIFTLIQFFIFLRKTLVLFSNYFLGYIRLRFFNNYINLKITLILNYIENYSKDNNINEKIDNIEIIQNNFDELILTNIINEQYERFDSIKVQAFKIKNNFHYDNLFKNIQKDILENRNEIFELSKNFNVSKIVDSPRLFNILKKQSSYNVTLKKNSLIFSSNLQLKEIARNSMPINSNKLSFNFKERKSIFHQLKENKDLNLNNSTMNNSLNITNGNYNNNTNVNKSTNSNNNLPSFTNVSNVTMNKSNVNLMNTNRSNISHKSSLKLLNEDHKNNLSQSKNVSKNQFIKNEKENELQKKYLLNGKTLLNKPYLYFNFLLFLFIMIIINISIASIQILLSITFINNTKSMIQMEYDIFLFLKYNIQFVFFYGFILLKNEPLIFYYQGNEFTSDCETLNSHMQINYTHNIFIESQTCYSIIKSRLEKIPSGKINKHLIKLKKIHEQFYSNNFCSKFSNYIIENKENIEIMQFINLTRYSNESLYNECIHIGNGINLKGYNVAIDTIYQTLLSYYEDFLNDNRTEESNLKRVNDYIFKASLFENVKITRKLSIIYLTVFNKDFNYYREEIILGESIIFFVQIIVMLIITVIYIGNLKQFGKENEKVNFFNKCLINSILYK